MIQGDLQVSPGGVLELSQKGLRMGLEGFWSLRVVTERGPGV